MDGDKSVGTVNQCNHYEKQDGDSSKKSQNKAWKINLVQYVCLTLGPTSLTSEKMNKNEIILWYTRDTYLSISYEAIHKISKKQNNLCLVAGEQTKNI